MLNDVHTTYRGKSAPVTSASPNQCQEHIPDPASSSANDAASLFEAYYPLVVSQAKHYAATHSPFRIMEVADLIQEGSLALMEVIGHAERVQNGSFQAYAIGAIKHAFTCAHATDALIKVPHTSYWKAKQKGTLHEVLQPLRTFSLDRPIVHDDAQAPTWADRLAAPALILSIQTDEQPSHLLSLFESVPQVDEGTIDHSLCCLDRILETLPIRQQQVLRLRYGLGQEQEYSRSREEVAQVLGIACRSVADAEQRGLYNLRTYQARHNGQRSPRSFSMLGNTNATLDQHRLEQQRKAQTARLQAAYEHLLAQGVPPTCRALAALTQIDTRTVGSFLHERREGTAQERLQNTYTSLCAQGQTPPANLLCRLAQVPIPIACAFLRAQTGEQANTEMSTQERLSNAYMQLQAQEAAISVPKLRALAHVGRKEARQFLRSRGVPPGKGGRPPHTKDARHETMTVL